jgi:hypothetical protein
MPVLVLKTAVLCCKNNVFFYNTLHVSARKSGNDLGPKHVARCKDIVLQEIVLYGGGIAK